MNTHRVWDLLAVAACTLGLVLVALGVHHAYDSYVAEVHEPAPLDAQAFAVSSGIEDHRIAVVLMPAAVCYYTYSARAGAAPSAPFCIYTGVNQ